MKLREFLLWVLLIGLVIFAIYYVRIERSAVIDRDYYKERYEGIAVQVDSLSKNLVLLEVEIEKFKRESDSIRQQANIYLGRYTDIKRKYDDIRRSIIEMTIDEKIRYFTELTGIDVSTITIDGDTLYCMELDDLRGNIDLVISLHECEENLSNCHEYSSELEFLIVSKDGKINLLEGMNENLKAQLGLLVEENRLRKEENKGLQHENDKLINGRRVERVIGVALIIVALAL